MLNPIFFLPFFAIVMMSLVGTTQQVQAGSATNKPVEARVKPIPFEQLNARQREVLGIVEGQQVPGRAKTKLFRTLIHHPDLMAVYDPLGYSINRAPEISERHRELIIMRVGWLYQGEYEWAQHYDRALSAGWTTEDIERIKQGPEVDGWGEFDRTLLRAADQLVQNAFLEDDVWAALRQEYSVQDVMVLITLVTHYHWVAMMTKSLAVELEQGKLGFER